MINRLNIKEEREVFFPQVTRGLYSDKSMKFRYIIYRVSTNIYSLVKYLLYKRILLIFSLSYQVRVVLYKRMEIRSNSKYCILSIITIACLPAPVFITLTTLTTLTTLN